MKYYIGSIPRKQFHTWEGHNRQGVVKPGPRFPLAADRPIREQTLHSGQCLEGWAHGGTNGPLVEGGWWVKRVVGGFMRRPLKHLSSALVALLYSSRSRRTATSGIISLNCILHSTYRCTLYIIDEIFLDKRRFLTNRKTFRFV